MGWHGSGAAADADGHDEVDFRVFPCPTRGPLPWLALLPLPDMHSTKYAIFCTRMHAKEGKPGPGLTQSRSELQGLTMQRLITDEP